jgi:hypothetical protein
MSIAKQIYFVNLIPAYNNGVANFPFEGSVGTDFKFKAWNVNVSWVMEYYGSTVDEALSGFKRSNVRGYRMKASLTLDNSTENSRIRTLLNYFSAGFRRKAWQLLSSAVLQNSSTIALASGSGFPSTNDFFNGLYMYVSSTLSGTAYRILDYDGSTGQLQLGSSASVPASSILSIAVGIEMPTIMLFDITGSATTSTDVDLVPCNVTNLSFLLNRQSTIHTQPMTIELESINLYQQIPDDYRIA